MTADGDWANFVRGIDRVALERERLPRLRDPESERPGSFSDKRMRQQHAERAQAFREACTEPKGLTHIERFEARTYRERPLPAEQQQHRKDVA